MDGTENSVIRTTLASVWLVTGLLSLGIYPIEDSLQLLARVGITGTPGYWLLYGEAVLDTVLGILTLTHPGKMLRLTQAGIIAAYTQVISVFLPEFWLHPFGPILKNLPIFTLLWLLYRHEALVT
jgi:hypothetical protein